MKVAKGFDISGYKKADISAAQKGSGWDENDQQRYDELIASRSKAKSKAQAQKKKPAPKPKSKQQQPKQQPKQKQPKQEQPAPQQHINNASPNANDGGSSVADGSQTQNVNQDNDINTDINGNQNTVVNNQDNSIRQYGGNTKVFNYQGGKGESGLYDSAVSAGTMGGFFHDEDSPASSASFMDRYSTMNKDAQKKYNNTGIAATAIGNARNNKAINIGNLDNKIEARIKASRARSTSMAGNIFGDMFNFKPIEFKAPKAPDAIDGPNFGK